MTERATERDRENLRKVAAAILSRELTILEGTRALFRYAHNGAIREEADRKAIIAIESETDNLPVGEVRKLWAADALRMKDIEIARSEKLYGERVIGICRRILNA